jgi:hypothetical protein
VDPDAAQLAIADLLLGDPSRAIYRDLIAQKERVPELFELDQGFAPVLGSGAAEDLDGTRGEPCPVLARQGR